VDEGELRALERGALEALDRWRERERKRISGRRRDEDHLKMVEDLGAIPGLEAWALVEKETRARREIVELTHELEDLGVVESRVQAYAEARRELGSSADAGGAFFAEVLGVLRELRGSTEKILHAESGVLEALLQVLALRARLERRGAGPTETRGTSP